jgi:class III poly(R)-hydroxyalkanoic acid synthase PhaE subunit
MEFKPPEPYAFPSSFSRMVKSGWDWFFHFGEVWLQLGGWKEARGKVDDSRHPGQQALQAWNDFYEQEFKRFLSLPQLGLTRYYQEEIEELIDKFAVFQGKMTEFVFCLSLPMEKSFVFMQQKVDELVQSGKPFPNPKDHYHLWIKLLEDYYLSFFRSADYAGVMNGALNALEEFLAARQKVLNRFLQLFSIPTTTEMDDLSKDLYGMKKRVRELENKLNPGKSPRKRRKR